MDGRDPMSLAEKVVIVVVCIVLLALVVYAIVALAIWRELKHARHGCKECTEELERLEFARKSILQAVDLAEDNLKKCRNEQEKQYHEKRSAEMKKALEKNERGAQEVQNRLKEYQEEVEICKRGLMRMKSLAWLRNQ